MLLVILVVGRALPTPMYPQLRRSVHLLEYYEATKESFIDLKKRYVYPIHAQKFSKLKSLYDNQ